MITVEFLGAGHEGRRQTRCGVAHHQLVLLAAGVVQSVLHGFGAACRRRPGVAFRSAKPQLMTSYKWPKKKQHNKNKKGQMSQINMLSLSLDWRYYQLLLKARLKTMIYTIQTHIHTQRHNKMDTKRTLSLFFG